MIKKEKNESSSSSESEPVSRWRHKHHCKKHHTSSRKPRRRLSSKRSESSLSFDSDSSHKSFQHSYHRPGYPGYDNKRHHYHYLIESTHTNQSSPYVEYPPNIHSLLSTYPHTTLPTNPSTNNKALSQNLYQSPDYVPLPRPPPSVQPLSIEPTMPTSDFGLHMKKTPVYPLLT